MEFFEPPPPCPRPRRRRRRQTPPWFSAPDGVLPGVVAVELVVARTDRVAVCVSRLAAYASGFELDLVTMASREDDEDDELDPMLFGGRRMRSARSAGEHGIPDEMLRFGVEFADGAKATNTDAGPFTDSLDGDGESHVFVAAGARADAREREPAGPVLQPGGGGGGGGSWRQHYWVWPLPPPGRVTFVCQWPAAEIELTRCDVDASVILDAVGRAQVIFESAALDDDEEHSAEG